MVHGPLSCTGGAECQEKVADIVFLLDSSVSLWLREFGAQLAFVQDIVHSFTIGPNNIRVGVVTFRYEPCCDLKCRCPLEYVGPTLLV